MITFWHVHHSASLGREMHLEKVNLLSIMKHTLQLYVFLGLSCFSIWSLLTMSKFDRLAWLEPLQLKFHQGLLYLNLAISDRRACPRDGVSLIWWFYTLNFETEEHYNYSVIGSLASTLVVFMMLNICLCNFASTWTHNQAEGCPMHT